MPKAMNTPTRRVAMATEVNLTPGWFIKDVRRAAERLNEWSTMRDASMNGSVGRETEQAPSRSSPSAVGPNKPD
jgi:hypothetical protein